MTREAEGGYIDHAPFPHELEAHVVEPGPRPRILGYDVQADLARHYEPLDLLLLSMIGELPTPDQREFVATGMSLSAVVQAGEGPSRAATIARLTAPKGLGALRVGWLALVDAAERQVEERAKWWAQLSNPESVPAQDREQGASTLDAWLAERYGARVQYLGDARDAFEAALALFYAAGIQSKDQVVALLCFARMPTVLAEAARSSASGFAGHPFNTPVFVYDGLEEEA